MSEQEFRDYVKAWTHTFEPRSLCFYGNKQYMAHIAVLDDDTLAMRVMRNDIVVSSWGIYTYAHAANVLAWAESGGNWAEWKDEVSE